MPFTVTKAANLAILHCGAAKTIDDLDNDPSTPGIVCRQFFDVALEEVSRDYDWPFLRKRVALSKIADNPDDEWGVSYQYPPDCAFAIRIANGNRSPALDEDEKYEIVFGANGTEVYTNLAAAELVYTRRVTHAEFGRLPADFVMAFSYRLAVLIAPHVTEGNPAALQNRLLGLYVQQLTKAAATAKNEVHRDEEPESDLIRARG